MDMAIQARPPATALWVAERYWPGLTEANARAALAALHAACTTLGDGVDVLDGTWLPEDETLTARFLGTRAAVVAAHELAHATFDRLSRGVELSGAPRRQTGGAVG